VPVATTPEQGGFLGRPPVLPFVLGTLSIAPVREESQIESILVKLEALEEVARASRLELANLRSMSTDILEAVRAARHEPAPDPIRDNGQSPPAGPDETERPLRLHLLGSFDVIVQGQPVGNWPSKKARLLLAYLSLERGRMVPKDVLIDLLWPEVPPERGSNNLSIAVHQIRSTLAKLDSGAAQAVLVRQGLYGIDQALTSVDLWDYQALSARARQALEKNDRAATRGSLVAAVDLCRAGELLESEPYEDWAIEPRRALGAFYNQALAWLATEAAQSNDWTRVADYAGRIVERERCDEAGHRWLMQAHVRLGNRAQALQQYRLCEAWLREDLGVEPSEETRRVFRSIRGSG